MLGKGIMWAVNKAYLRQYQHTPFESPMYEGGSGKFEAFVGEPDLGTATEIPLGTYRPARPVWTVGQISGAAGDMAANALRQDTLNRLMGDSSGDPLKEAVKAVVEAEKAGDEEIDEELSDEALSRMMTDAELQFEVSRQREMNEVEREMAKSFFMRWVNSLRPRNSSEITTPDFDYEKALDELHVVDEESGRAAAREYRKREDAFGRTIEDEPTEDGGMVVFEGGGAAGGDFSTEDFEGEGAAAPMPPSAFAFEEEDVEVIGMMEDERCNQARLERIMLRIANSNAKKTKTSPIRISKKEQDCPYKGSTFGDAVRKQLRSMRAKPRVVFE